MERGRTSRVKAETVIWGAGRWGAIAYYYYKDRFNLVCYVDRNKEIWGQKLNGLEICSPEMLFKKKAAVIIANKNCAGEIFQCLEKDFKISDRIIFNADKIVEDEKIHVSKSELDELIISFSGGLGNQMFEYALYQIFEKQGKNVKADCSHYSISTGMPFTLNKVFTKIRINDDFAEERKKIYSILAEIDRTLVYIEAEEDKFAYNPLLLDRERGYVVGYHQSFMYPDIVKKELIEDFEFDIKDNEEVLRILGKLKQRGGELVSVHVRRGDYLQGGAALMFGNICTGEYYQKAMDLIRSRVKKSVFCFFSNDIEWVKKEYGDMKAVFIEKKMFEKYQDWYDMYLMSQCRHNIIANSTFSWWGAWLNQNPDKIVIAPSKWVNDNVGRDICPDTWIRI